MSGAVRSCLPLLTLVALAACAETDPYQKAGQWQPTGANALNLAAMVASPADLLRGRGERGAQGKEAAPAVERLFQGRPAALPAAGSQQPPPAPAAAPFAGPN